MASASLILVTGSTGQVGGELIHTLAPFGEIVAPTRAEMDLAETASIQAFIRSTRPRWIVNAAAHTAVDKAETEPALASAINTDAIRTIGIEAHALNIPVLHFSTDYVFNGQKSTPYIESDPTGPLGVYGATKLAGEQALLASGASAMVFRTSWVYGATGKNFLRTILKLARERDSLNIVGDQHGAPTWSRDLALMAAQVISHCERTAAQTSEPIATSAAHHTGIYHAGGSGETTWAGFAAEAIRQLQQLEPATKLATITAIPTSAYPTPAARPTNSRMSNEKLFQTFSYRMMDWHDSLAQVLDELT